MDFSPLKNDLFDFQQALLSNELKFFDAVFGKTICFYMLYQHIAITLK